MNKKQFIKNRPFDEVDALDMQTYAENAIKDNTKQFYSAGVVKGLDIQFVSGMKVKVMIGAGYDTNFNLLNNIAEYQVTLANADTQDRIDIISLKYKQNTIDNIDTTNKYNRGTSWTYSKNLLDSFDVILRKGTASATPIKPIVPSDEIALGSILVKANAISVINTNITDERVMSRNTAIPTINNASTSQAGIVQLNDNTNSTSTTQAATPNSVKVTNDSIANIKKDIEILYWMGGI